MKLYYPHNESKQVLLYHPLQSGARTLLEKPQNSSNYNDFSRQLNNMYMYCIMYVSRYAGRPKTCPILLVNVVQPKEGKMSTNQEMSEFSKQKNMQDQGTCRLPIRNFSTHKTNSKQVLPYYSLQFGAQTSHYPLQFGARTLLKIP